MRFATSSLCLSVPLRFTIRTVSGRGAFILLLLIAAVQPLGSSMALVLYAALAAVGAVFFRTPAKPVASFIAWVGFLAVTSLASAAFVSVNPLLVVLYSAYLLFVVYTGTLVYKGVMSMSREEGLTFVRWALLLDLAVNLPAVLAQLAIWGPGDMIQGFSGLGIGDALSQNRTNAVRAGFFIVLALASLRDRKTALAMASLAFNASVLVLATSMTTLFSAILALIAMVAARKSLLRLIPYLIILVLAGYLADKLNQSIFKSPSIFDFLATINTRWVPKLDIYPYYFSEVARENPFSLFFGNGVGNFANRFVILTNYENYANIPFKDELSRIFRSEMTLRHIIHHYYLESGILGSSILSVPWSGIIGAITEIGLLGLALGAFIARKWVRGFLRTPKGSWNYGMALLFFLIFNLLFDCYVDYPEVVFPFVIVSACLSRISSNVGEQGGEGGAAPGQITAVAGHEA